MPTAGKRSYRTLLRQGERLLRRRAKPDPCEDAGTDAFLLMEKATGLTRTDYPLKKDQPYPPQERAEYLALLRRRAAGEPVQYLLGEWDFMGLTFAVGPGVLIPRPETELLAETAIACLRGRQKPRVLELCGGSGCIAIAVAKAVRLVKDNLELCGLSDRASVRCGDAMSYLQKNIARHGVKNVTAVQGDALSPPPTIAGRYDAILSNPPYIARSELPTLQREVRREPAMALDGGADGLDFYRGFNGIYPKMLTDGGLLLYEIGEEQGDAVAALLREAGLERVSVLRDLYGLPRDVLGYAPDKK